LEVYIRGEKRIFEGLKDIEGAKKKSAYQIVLKTTLRRLLF